jgi:hypothetical protein
VIKTIPTGGTRLAPTPVRFDLMISCGFSFASTTSVVLISSSVISPSLIVLVWGCQRTAHFTGYGRFRMFTSYSTPFSPQRQVDEPGFQRMTCFAWESKSGGKESEGISWLLLKG